MCKELIVASKDKSSFKRQHNKVFIRTSVRLVDKYFETKGFVNIRILLEVESSIKQFHSLFSSIRFVAINIITF